MHVNWAAPLEAESIAWFIQSHNALLIRGCELQWTIKISRLPFGIHVSSLRRMCAIGSDDDHIRDNVGFEKVVAAHVHINIITSSSRNCCIRKKNYSDLHHSIKLADPWGQYIHGLLYLTKSWPSTHSQYYVTIMRTFLSEMSIYLLPCPVCSIWESWLFNDVLKRKCSNWNCSNVNRVYLIQYCRTDFWIFNGKPHETNYST